MAKEGDKKTKITFGGWYQRTTLHLTEVYGFLKNIETRLPLSRSKLRELHKKLNLKNVERKLGYLEYIEAVTRDNIIIRYYEDGLYKLEITSENIQDSAKKLKQYFDQIWRPAIEYLFSLGSPTPKILSNIKQEHPIVISQISKNPGNYNIDKKYGQVYSKTRFKNIAVYKTRDYIFVIASQTQEQGLPSLVEMQIFFREFKDQLHRYLNIHRIIWEEIEEIKEKHFIKGKEIAYYRSELESYKKTIGLIVYRINQMQTYAGTRASLAKYLRVESQLVTLFKYRFEDLFNTLTYIKDIWSMTINHVNSAIQVLVELGDKVNMSGIRSIQILASIGVVTGVLGYLSTDAVPKLTNVGAGYLFALGIIAFIVDLILKRSAKNKEYEVKFVERSKKI